MPNRLPHQGRQALLGGLVLVAFLGVIVMVGARAIGELPTAVEALLEADTTSTRTRLYQALLDATLLVPLSGLAPGDLQGRWRWLADEPLVELAVTQQPDARITVPVSTTTEAAGRWIGPAQPPADLAALVLLTGRQAFALALCAGVTQVVVDPPSLGRRLAGPAFPAGTIRCARRYRMGGPWPHRPGHYSQPALRAIRMASMRLRPPTLAMALDR